MNAADKTHFAIEAAADITLDRKSVSQRPMPKPKPVGSVTFGPSVSIQTIRIRVFPENDLLPYTKEACGRRRRGNRPLSWSTLRGFSFAVLAYFVRDGFDLGAGELLARNR